MRYLLASRASDSLATARRALTLARERGERLHEAHTLWLVGEAFAQASSPNELSSERSYREALTLATELNMRPLAAHCHLGLGKLHGRTGDCVKGEEHLNTAMMMVPRDGYALLAAASRSGAGSVRLMHCPVCGFDNRERVRFCEECGGKLE